VAQLGPTQTNPRQHRHHLLACQRVFDHSLLKQPGDFGVVNEGTGELAIEGNIYTHVDTMSIASRYPVVPAPEVDQFEIHSYEVREIGTHASAGA